MEDSALEGHLRRHLDDWDCWLVYADWLLEQGDIRGRLIGLAHQMATAEMSAAQRRDVQGQIDAIEAQYARSWREELAEGIEVQWRHGFIVAAYCPWKDEALDALETMASHPAGRLFSSLRMNPYSYGDYRAPIEQLTHRKLMRSITSLDLSSRDIGPSGAASLARSELWSLTRLVLERCQLGDAGIRALFKSTALHKLDTLSLASNGIGTDGVEALVQTEFSNLSALDLKHNHIDDAGAASLARSRTLRGLAMLDLEGNPIGEAGARVLADAEVFGSLVELNLDGTSIGKEGRVALSLSETLGRCSINVPGRRGLGKEGAPRGERAGSLCAQSGSCSWMWWGWGGQSLTSYGAALPTEGKSGAWLSDDERLLSVLDRGGRRLRGYTRWQRGLRAVPIPELPSGYRGICTASRGGVLYVACGPVDEIRPRLTERLMCLPLDASAAGQWRTAEIPEGTQATGKTIDALFFRGQTLIAVDNVVVPKYILTYNLSDPLLPRLDQVRTLRDFGAGGHIECAALGARWLAVVSRHFGRDGRFYSIKGLTLLEADCLDERWHYTCVMAENGPREPAEFMSDTGGLRTIAAVAWDEDLLLIAGGTRGMGVVDMRHHAPQGPSGLGWREERIPMVPGPDIVYIRVPGVASVDDVRTVQGHAGGFCIDQTRREPWRPVWISRETILRTLEADYSKTST